MYTFTTTPLPSRELGGDCFDYRWVDDDHPLVYLIETLGLAGFDWGNVDRDQNVRTGTSRPTVAREPMRT